jgi:hypothetical protein
VAGGTLQAADVDVLNNGGADVGGVSLDGATGTWSGGAIDANNGDVGGVLAPAGSYTLQGVSISGNDGVSVGGVSIEGGLGLLDATVDDNDVVGPTGLAGGVYVGSGGALDFIVGSVSGNTGGGSAGGLGGGITVEASGGVLVDRVVVADNAGFRGGGLYIEGGQITLANLRIEGNVADEDGGGLWYNQGGHSPTSLDADWLRVVGNEAVGGLGAGRGGGMYLAGAIGAQFSHLEIGGNTAQRGGALYLNGGTSMSRTTMVGNAASAGVGAAVCAAQGDLFLDSSVVSGHDAGTVFDGDGCLLFPSGVGKGVVLQGVDRFNAGAEVGTGLVFDTSSGTNPTVDPQLVDTSGDAVDWDLRLGSGSPLIGQGGAPFNAFAADPDGSASDLGAWSGPDADGWDLDGDGWNRFWQPGPWSSAYASLGFECDDRTIDAAPGCD